MNVIVATYDYRLVTLSVVIAIIASYTALDLAGRITASRGYLRIAWLSGGAIAMGSGIWAMHYTGMLAFRLPMHVYYHVPTVVFSLVAAILASLIALLVVGRRNLMRRHVIAGSFLMGAGIATMHYTGMAAMRMAAMHYYHKGLWLLSVALAVVISLVGLWLISYFRDESRGWKLKLPIAVVMGLAIPVMHYTGMAAVSFMPTKEAPNLSHAVDISTLASSGIILVTLVMLGFALLTSLIDRRLSEQTRQLEASKERYQLLFESNPHPTFVFDLQTFFLLAVNHAAVRTYGFSLEEFLTMKITALYAAHDLDSLFGIGQSGAAGEAKHLRKDGVPIEVELRLSNISWNGKAAALLLANDITERKKAERDRDGMEVQLRHAQKLESIGQLAAGIAHEINTPTQYIGDNVRFLSDAFEDLKKLLADYERLLEVAKSEVPLQEKMGAITAAIESVDTGYLLEEIPKAIRQTLEGVDRVATLVSAMKEFSHPGSKEKSLLNLNKAIESTITVARNEWKYVADMETDFDPALPQIACLPGEFNQVILNMIVNAAHAIADVTGNGSQGKGQIKVKTANFADFVEVRIQDTGSGIPEKARSRVFDPFFTTKEVGKGTGQGLAIARSVIVDKHGGSIHFETAEGKGTTFIIRLPHDGKAVQTETVLA